MWLSGLQGAILLVCIRWRMGELAGALLFDLLGMRGGNALICCHCGQCSPLPAFLWCWCAAAVSHQRSHSPEKWIRPGFVDFQLVKCRLFCGVLMESSHASFTAATAFLAKWFWRAFLEMMISFLCWCSVGLEGTVVLHALHRCISLAP
jgi:hypothetical protein